MTNRPFCRNTGDAVSGLVGKRRAFSCARKHGPPVLADVVFCHHCASVLVLQADLTPRFPTPIEIALALRAYPVLLTMKVAVAKCQRSTISGLRRAAGREIAFDRLEY